MHRFYLIFGLFSGLSSLVLQFLYYNGNIPLDKGGIVNVLILLLLAICVIFSAIAYKKEKGEVSFMRVVFGGFLVALIATIPSAIWYNTTYLINPNFFQPVKEYQLESKSQLLEEADAVKKEKGEKVTPLTKKEKEEMLHKVEVGSQPGWYTIMFLIMNIVIAVVLSAFTAAFIAKKT
jgi:hypothetical protein